MVIDNNKQAYQAAQLWTCQLIDAVLQLQGTYYLSYHLFATSQQFLQAYPRYDELLDIKKKYDPLSIFQNSLHCRYAN